MIRKVVSSFSPRFPLAIAYMLQSTEYDVRAYLRWLWSAKSFSSVMVRRTLDRTFVSQAFIIFMYIGIVIQLVVAAALFVHGFATGDTPGIVTGCILLFSAPFAWAHLVLIPLFVAKHFIINRRARAQQAVTQRIMSEHKGVKIAVAGSFGKTTMKELLSTVLTEGKHVAATPGNKNVASAHYDFARSLTGKEDIIIVEFGEGSPGDVARFTETIEPDMAVITGIAAAHLDQYADVDEAARDIFTVANHPTTGNVYVNTDSEYVSDYISPGYIAFNESGLDGWEAKDVRVDLEGTHFTLVKGDSRLTINSKLIGKHLVGVLSATAVIAKKIGLSSSQIEAGFQKTSPYEHRMQPYRIGGAWVLDDSYNGNLQGIKAGTELLGSLRARRRIYVTPGLVDQGVDSPAIHNKIGRLIAAAKPDVVVLMKNSVTNDIVAGLKSAEFDKELIIQSDPLLFYKNLDQFVANGDIVLLQNDWTDNYQ